jgi:16S rRNA (adenine1518-N6/adenine1519-N6)-dimethyltransferase
MRQKWGQNFLADASVARHIVDSLPTEGLDRILEIGPGKGVLTERLLAKKLPVTAVELDTELVATLGRRWGSSYALTVVNVDFLRWPLPDWPPRSTGVIGNLPYSAGNAIVQKFLDWPAWGAAVIMVQKEVADRMVAPPDTPDYGILSLAVQGKSRAEKIFDVPPGAFKPAPKVTSSVLSLVPLPVSLLRNEKRFFEVAHAAFSQRRKMLLNNLSHGLDLEKPHVIAVLEKNGIDPTRRPQTLTLEEFNRLSEIL